MEIQTQTQRQDSKHLRKRKKKLLNSIREQIEFYFSDANLRHDRFMRQLVGADDQQLKGRQSVDLKQFLNFNKISEKTKNIRDISLSLESSKCLYLDQNQLTVKRIEPFLQNDINFDESTIYVERLPPNADQQWIRSVFGGFGRIEFIKIPHFRHNNNIMGFAFIEFSEPIAAQKALKHFNGLSSNHKNQSQVEIDSDLDQIPSSSQSEPKSDPKTDVSRKRTVDSTPEEVIESKRAKISEENDSTEKVETNTKKKKKRKRKRKTITTVPTEDNESEVINLRVMSKKEWKSWKNKYLKLQKQSMTSIKRSLLIDNQNEKQENTETESNKVVNNCEDKSFERGLIIQLKFSMPSKHLNENDFKRNIRQIGGKDIQYIDLPLNQLKFFGDQTVGGVCYVRTNSCEDTKRLLANETLKQLGDLNVLEANEETDYWNQIFEERLKKRSNNWSDTKKHKIRGFDRIINRVENMRTSVDTKVNKHIKFDT